MAPGASTKAARGLAPRRSEAKFKTTSFLFQLTREPLYWGSLRTGAGGSRQTGGEALRADTVTHPAINQTSPSQVEARSPESPAVAQRAQRTGGAAVFAQLGVLAPGTG